MVLLEANYLVRVNLVYFNYCKKKNKHEKIKNALKIYNYKTKFEENGSTIIYEKNK